MGQVFIMGQNSGGEVEVKQINFATGKHSYQLTAYTTKTYKFKIPEDTKIFNLKAYVNKYIGTQHYRRNIFDCVIADSFTSSDEGGSMPYMEGFIDFKNFIGNENTEKLMKIFGTAPTHDVDYTLNLRYLKPTHEFEVELKYFNLDWRSMEHSIDLEVYYV